MIYERIVVPTVSYGAETFGLNARENRTLSVMEIKLGIGSVMKKS